MKVSPLVKRLLQNIYADSSVNDPDRKRARDEPEVQLIALLIEIAEQRRERPMLFEVIKSSTYEDTLAKARELLDQEGQAQAA